MVKHVVSKSGDIRSFDISITHKAVQHSAECCRGLSFKNGKMQEYVYSDGTHLSKREWESFDSKLLEYLSACKKDIISTEELHHYIIFSLEKVCGDVASSYREFHYERDSFKASLELAVNERDSVSSDASNANADATLSSTIKSLSGDLFEKSANMAQLMTPQDREAHELGTLYWHDLVSLRAYPYNCCLLDLFSILSHPFSINGVGYDIPKSLSEAFDTVGDVIFCTASNQYGGCTAPRVDTLLAPYAIKEYEQQISFLRSLGVAEEKLHTAALNHVKEVARRGFSSWEIRFNTVGSSRGDYPFITITGGADASEVNGIAFSAILWEAALEVRRTGQGIGGKKRPVLFPKLVFLYDENLHEDGKKLSWLFDAGVECSSVTMYPDYLSLTGDGYVADIYKRYGEIISPMGCRAFLSPWFKRGGIYPADADDTPVFEGRFNIGVISLNLPLIYGLSVKNNWNFYSYLEYHLQLIRREFKRRYRRLGNLPASRNPLMFMNGGAYNPETGEGARLSANEKIAPLLKCATASFGITALNELQRLYNGKSLVEDGSFALEVMEYINQRINDYKEEDGYLYAIYGTPAENLCGVQARQLKKHLGVIPGVSDREYVSNSFHCHVTEAISPIQKQDLEKRFWDLFNGGKIQYVKYALGYNKKAIHTLVTRAMKLGFYEGVNLDLNFCGDCGVRFGDDIDSDCPCCGSKNIYSINRMNGYMGFSRQGSDKPGYDSRSRSRFNKAKLTEIRERKSM